MIVIACIGIITQPMPWVAAIMLMEHLILVWAYRSLSCRKENAQRQEEIDNITLKKDYTELKRQVGNLILCLEPHADFNGDIDDLLDVFSRTSHIKRHKTASK